MKLRVTAGRERSSKYNLAVRLDLAKALPIDPNDILNFKDESLAIWV